MNKVLDVQGKKSMRVFIVGMNEPFRNEKYYVGIKHNVPRKAFNYMIDQLVNCLEDDYLDAERLVFIINNAPECLNYKAEFLNAEEKSKINKAVEPKNQIVWK